MSTTRSSKSLAWLGLLAMLLIAYVAYRPGLAGGFLFDDFVNLNSLGKDGPIHDWPSFWRYLTSGVADPTGRPLSMLSFLIDSRDWPADPAPFLRTNLTIHLLNGSLLFFLLQRLGASLQSPGRTNDAIALLAAGLWTLHPLFVSTTLYVVQREAMLPATFVLLGLLAYAKGKSAFLKTDGRQGTTWMILGIIVGTVLATLCKANGLLLPLLALTLEATVYRTESKALSHTARTKFRKLSFLLLMLPASLLVAYIAHFTIDWNVLIESRGWTVGQRALTESRVLFDYLFLLVVPRSISSGLYNDDYAISQDLLNPLSTLPSLLFLLAIGWLALRYHKRFPALSAAIAFFLAGHLLESTLVPLEIYFEHRNYLPAMLLFWPLALAVGGMAVSAWTRITISVALVAVLAVTTYQRATLWGNPSALSAIWSKKNPASSRAQAAVAIDLMGSGNPGLAASHLRPLWTARPYDLQIAVNYIDAVCASGALQSEDKLALSRTFRNIEIGNDLLYRWLGKAIGRADTPECPGMTLSDVEAWRNQAAQNPAIQTFRSAALDLVSLSGKIDLVRGNPDNAFKHFERKLNQVPLPSVALQQAAWMASAGYPSHALRHLESFEARKNRIPPASRGMPQVHEWVLSRQGYWGKEISWMKSNLRQSAADSELKEPRAP